MSGTSIAPRKYKAANDVPQTHKANTRPACAKGPIRSSQVITPATLESRNGTSTPPATLLALTAVPRHAYHTNAQKRKKKSVPNAAATPSIPQRSPKQKPVTHTGIETSP